MRPHFSRLIPCPPRRWLRVESRVHAREETTTTSRGNFKSSSYRMITTTTTTNINRINRTSASSSLNSSSTTSTSAAPLKRLTTRPQLDHPRRAFSDKVTFQSPFYQLTHCDHCYPGTSTEAQPQALALGKKTTTRVRSSSTNTLETTTTSNLVHAHVHQQQHQQHHPHSHNMSTTSSAPAPALASTPSTTPTTTTKKPPTPGQGILVPASKVHTAVKTELLNTLSQPEFTEGDSNSGSNSASGAEGKGKGRVPKLVGILATDKEDAASYAEVSRIFPGSVGSRVKVGWSCRSTADSIPSDFAFFLACPPRHARSSHANRAPR